MPAKSVFCVWHVVTVENTAGTDCSAHLNEARCFECPYTDPHDALTAKSPCSDFEPLVSMERI